MRIAHCVESYAPAMGGMVEVVRQLSERMVKAGHEVTVYTSEHAQRTTSIMNGVRVRSFPLNGNAASGIIGDADTYVLELIESEHDIVTFFAAQQWATDAVLPHLGALRAKKVFVPTGFSGLHAAAWSAYYTRMPAWLAAMDLNVFHSEGYQDVLFAQAHGIANRVLIPNGAAHEEFNLPSRLDVRALLGLRKVDRVILHVGSYTGIKGHREAIRIFLRAYAPGTVMLFIGNGVAVLERTFRRHWRFLPLRIRSLFAGKRILFREWDRAHTVAAMQQADLFLFPSQVECSPIVLFESLAARTPFLASTAGNAGEIARWTGGGWTIGGTIDALGRTHIDIGGAAQRLTALIADPAALTGTGERGRAAWAERFTWAVITQRYLSEYERLVHSHG